MIRLPPKYTILAFLFLCFFSCVESEKQKDESGRIDLTGSNKINQFQSIIDENIVFYWQQFPYDSLGNFNSNVLTDKSTLKENSYLWTDIDLPPEGYGTFRLLIKNVNKDQSLGLRLQSTKSAAEIWVNNEKITSIGEIGTSKETTTANGKFILVELPKASSLDIIIPVSNYHHRIGGGFSQGLLLDNYNKLKQKRDLSIFMETLLVSIIFIVGILSLYMFMISTRRKIYLFFGLFALSIMARQILVGEVIIYIIFPELSHAIVQKARYLTFYLALIFASHYYLYLFSKDIKKPIIKTLTYIIITAGLFVILSPVYISTYAATPMAIIALLIISLGVYFSVIGLIRKRKFAGIILVSTLLGIAFVINDVLFSRRIIQTAFLMNYGFLSYILLQSYINFKLIKDERNEFQNIKSKLNVLETQVAHKSSEVTQLISETIDHIKSKEQIAQRLKTIKATDNDLVIKDILSDLQSDRISEEKMLIFKQNINELNAGFKEVLKTKHPSLTKTDIEICMLMKVGLSKKEIANLRNTSTEAVKKSRQRIRHKLNIEGNVEEYLKSIKSDVL